MVDCAHRRPRKFRTRLRLLLGICVCGTAHEKAKTLRGEDSDYCQRQRGVGSSCGTGGGRLDCERGTNGQFRQRERELLGNSKRTY